MEELSHYALWLLPDAGDTRLIELAMEQINEALPGPRFTPHISLFDSLTGDEAELGDKVAALAEKISVFDAESEKLMCSQYYFRALYVRIKASPDMLRCRQLGTDAFALRLDKSFKPHISLLYSAASRDKKTTALADVHLNLPDRYNINRLALVRTALAVSDWQIVRELPLGG